MIRSARRLFAERGLTESRIEDLTQVAGIAKGTLYTYFADKDALIVAVMEDSLARLAGDEQKAVKTTAFDLQMNPASPGLSFHNLDKAKDKNFWSVRAGSDIRLIVHKTPGSLLLCYVDHHDKAYDWAERRKLETHPKTGAAQLVEIRETVKEVVVPVYVQAELPMPPKQKFWLKIL